MEASFRCSALKSVLPNKYLAQNLCSTRSSMWWSLSVKLSLCLSTVSWELMEVEGRLHVVLTSALHGTEWSASRCSSFIPDTNWTGGSVGLIAYNDGVTIENFLPLSGVELRVPSTLTRATVFLTFWTWQVRVSTERPTVLTEVFRGCSQSLQADAGIVPWNMARPLPFIFF
jgi:hypothetical protein